jgi:DNA-binding MarR family transcriptional regulator
MAEASPPADSVALIVRGVRHLARRLRAERPTGSVSGSALGVLATLHRLGPMPAVELARNERLKPQSLTRLIASLAADGLIARRRHSTDRRAWSIEITKSGRGALLHTIAAERTWLAYEMARKLSKREQQQLVNAALLMLKLAIENA